ncbi:hypothetical protein ACHHYP_08463 [Achlya hypogyna]|uniref:Uncharacterized protein n=1 Tax=Achlya hypogyna TaxID=1202772 RepID=A0A1V9YPM6_ACHHY|nr:hypothetical protein ACHHYP_08463 [Achlya hypogyna]
MAEVTFAGYDAANELFSLRRLLAADSGAEDADSELIARSLPDLQHWDRWLASRLKGIGRTYERLPSRRLKKLTAASWTLDDVAVGKRPELSKTLAFCNKWLRDLVAQLPDAQAHCFLDESAYAHAKDATTARLATQKAAKDLGQFFSSDASMARVADCLQALHVPDDIAASVFLEPSCGDGRFFAHITRIGGRQIIGCEIDAAVAALATACLPAELGHVLVGDFLTTKCDVPATTRVIAVGNPPFSNPVGDGEDIVHRFFRHCAAEWHATTIAFILPDRCMKPGYTDGVVALLTTATGRPWQLDRSMYVADSHFDFVGTKRIRKPSVIQVYHRRE